MKAKKSLLSAKLSQQRKQLVVLVCLSFALGAAIVAQAALFATVVDRVFVQSASFSAIAALLVVLLAVMAVRALFSYWNGRVGLNMAAGAKTSMRNAAIRHLARSSLPASLSGQTGGKVSLVLDAVDEADSYFSQYMPRMMEMAVVPLMILAVVFSQHLYSGLIMLITAPFIPVFMILVGLKTKKKSEEKFAQLAEFSGTFLDSLQGLVSLKLFGRTERQRQEIERSSLGFRDATMGILRVAFTNTFMLELIVMLSIGLVALELAFQLFVFHTISFATAFFILLLVPEFYTILKNTGTAFHSGRTSMGAAKKVEEMLSSSSAVAEKVVEPRDSNGQPGKIAQPAGNHDEFTKPAELRVPSESGNAAELKNSQNDGQSFIELQDVGFEYGPDAFSLRTGKVAIARGKQIAIVGKSGSGKTTLLHLMAGLLQPTAGAVLVNGRPLKDHDEQSWFAQVSYITQHPYIFAGTLAENMAIGADREVSRAELEKAAAAAGLGEVIAGLEQGLDTPVGEGGRGLSGGEMQRLALARAFLNQPSVVLFDEPTVGLDLHTERILQKSIAELAQKATMITVAHRLHTIRHADVILFLHNGQVLDSGSHEELLARLPQYAEMVDVHRGGKAQ